MLTPFLEVENRKHIFMSESMFSGAHLSIIECPQEKKSL